MKFQNENREAPALVRCPPDIICTALFVILICIGTVMLYSAGSAYYEDDPTYFIGQRAWHLVIGGIAFAIPALGMNLRNGRVGGALLYLGSLLMLVLVLIFGKTAGGAQRWIDLGFFQFQPSEIAKTAVVLVLADYYSRNTDTLKWNHGKNKKRFFINGFLYPLIIIGVPCLLIFFEHHLSAILITAGLGGLMMLLGGTNIFGLIGLAVCGSGGAWHLANAIPYTRERIEGLLNRGSNSENDWQTTEGLYAMGNGGFFGLGIGNSALKYGYVSQPQNDFIFAVVCEELGFFGAMVIILLFFAVFARGIRLSQKCENRYCSLVIAGISLKFIIHVLLNIAVVAAVIPNTGISLPFFSSGGSATIVQFFDAGLVIGMSCYAHD